MTLARFYVGFAISPGDHSELLVSAFFTWARDEVIKTKSIPQGRIASHFYGIRPTSKSLSPGVKIFDSVMKTTCRHSANQDLIRGSVDAFQPFSPNHNSRNSDALFFTLLKRDARTQHWFHAFYPCLCGNTHLDVKKVDLIIIIRAKKDDVSENS